MIWLALAVAQDVQQPDVPPVNAQNYRAVMDAERTLWADDAGRILAKPTFKSRIFLHYVHNPFVFYRQGSDERTVLVSDALQLDLMPMFHVDRFRLGLDIPVYLVSAGQLTENGAGLGDIALDGRVTFLDRYDDPAGVALGGRVTLPTNGVDAPLGLTTPSAEVFGIVDGNLDTWTVAFNLGARFTPSNELTNVDLNDQIFARFGAGWQLVEDAGVSFDVNANLNLADPTNVAGAPVEGLLGGWGRIADDYVVRGGVGTGFTPGIGSGDFRALLSFGYEPPVDMDPDLDGLVGSEDLCPEDPEDKDDFEDLDGCPDYDNDKDGIVDTVDKCPLDPEDMDEFEDGDGCPDFTTQVTVRVQQQNGTAVPGAVTTVTGTGVDVSGPSGSVLDLHAGQYALGAQAPDWLPNELPFAVPLPEGQDTVVIVLTPDVIMGDLTLKVQDPTGKLLPDAIWYMDGGVGPAPLAGGQATVAVPAGKHALDIRHEGYVTDRRDITVPAKGKKEVVVTLKPSQVEVTREKIDIKGTVYFDTAKASIQARSFGLLDDVAGVLIDHPELTKIRIEGHTDSRGGADYNRRLSDDRAKSVRLYLIGKGVDAGRLEAIGYGEDKPVDPREIPEAWDKNRRVDFFIVERADDSGKPR